MRKQQESSCDQKKLVRTGDFAMDRYLNETTEIGISDKVSIEGFPLTSSLPAAENNAQEDLGVVVLEEDDNGRSDSTHQSGNSDDFDFASESGQYVQFIRQHPAYSWLVESLNQETRLSQGYPMS